jgi:nucleotide sugar dehydrogenase
MNNKQKVSVIGLGYVGFPVLCAVAETGLYNTVGFDISEEKITKARNHESPIEDEYAERVVKSVTYEASNDASVMKDTDIFIICVPTPVDELFNPDYGPVEGATKALAPYVKKGSYVILESTVNPGTCDEIVLPLLEKLTGLKGGVDFELAHCPERINPGDPKWNVTNIPRNVGSTTKEGTAFLAEFYRTFVKAVVNEMGSIKEAEATKIVENTFRDINIAYVNELAKSFDVLGIDVVNVIKGASNKPFAFMAHYPGCGVGGHCIPVDPYYLIERAKKQGFDHKFLRNARMVNNSMPHYTVEKLMLALNEKEKSIKGSTVVMLGLSYKANIADLRESPALEIKKILEKEYGAKLRIFEPHNLSLSTHKTMEEALAGADAVIVTVNHKEFVEYPVEKLAQVPIVIDGRNCLDKKALKELGVIYKGIGR